MFIPLRKEEWNSSIHLHNFVWYGWMNGHTLKLSRTLVGYLLRKF